MEDLERIIAHYQSGNDDEIRKNYEYGPDGFQNTEVWEAIVAEYRRRGLDRAETSTVKTVNTKGQRHRSDRLDRSAWSLCFQFVLCGQSHGFVRDSSGAVVSEERATEALGLSCGIPWSPATVGSPHHSQ